MTDDLVKRLRTKYCCSAWADDCNCGEAADRIEALTAENERLRGLVEELADDLEVEVRDRWGYDERLAHKLKRDMDVINRARAALGDTQ